MVTIISFANQALFLTNLFVFTYKILLKLLNRWSPPVENPDFFSRELFAPEPFEIPLYLILSIIFVIIILSKSLDFLTLRTSPKRGIFFLALLLSFYLNIGSYPMKNNVQFIENLVDPTTSVFILAVYLTTITIIIAAAYWLRRRWIFLLSLILIVIALFTFEPGFPSSAHDTSFFLGPIFEIAHGKTMFSETSSQYGFLSVLLLALLTRLHLFNPFYLPLLTWILYIFQYFLVFYIISKASRSLVFALIGLFSILTISYFSLFHLPNTFPQIGPMRWLPLIISLFLVQSNKNITNFKLIFLLSLLSLWNVEAGIALFLSYSFTLFLLATVKIVSRKNMIKSIIFLAVDMLTIFIILNVIHLVSGKQMINFVAAFTRLREFAIAGIAMIPMPWRTHFWLVLLIYFASIIYFFRQKKIELGGEIGRVPVSAQRFFQPVAGREHLREGKSRQNLTQLLLFSANLSLFASVYYVGRSHAHNLFHISLFFLLNTFIFIGLTKNEFIKIKHNKYSYFIFYILFFIFFIVYPAFNRKQALASMIKTKFDRLKNTSIFKPELEQQVKRYYFYESRLIKDSLPEEEILILSEDDTYLFYLIDKKNLLFDNPQSGIASASKTDLNLALKKAFKTCPQKIVVNCSLLGLCPNTQTFNHQAVNIQKVLLESLEKSCKVKYKPIK